MNKLKLWRYLPPSWAHTLAPIGLRLWTEMNRKNFNPEWHPFVWRGLKFSNRLGIAGGVDKNAELLDVWNHLGFGFVEVGTVTPYPQSANPGKIIDRDWENQNLWNKMGFPSHGCADVKANLMYNWSQFDGPIFINIGKNRTTSNEEAPLDYAKVARELKNYADAIVVNISSPNTKGLRDLHQPKYLKNLIRCVLEEAHEIPVLLKLSPDLAEEDLPQCILSAVDFGVSGFILTNTTLSRPPNCPFPNEGGLSGRDLSKLSEKLLFQTNKILNSGSENLKIKKDLLIISAGGVLTPEEYLRRINLGADLVQVYSALVFEGPQFVSKCANATKTKATKNRPGAR